MVENLTVQSYINYTGR